MADAGPSGEARPVDITSFLSVEGAARKKSTLRRAPAPAARATAAPSSPAPQAVHPPSSCHPATGSWPRSLLVFRALCTSTAASLRPSSSLTSASLPTCVAAPGASRSAPAQTLPLRSSTRWPAPATHRWWPGCARMWRSCTRRRARVGTCWSPAARASVWMPCFPPFYPGGTHCWWRSTPSRWGGASLAASYLAGQALPAGLRLPCSAGCGSAWCRRQPAPTYGHQHTLLHPPLRQVVTESIVRPKGYVPLPVAIDDQGIVPAALRDALRSAAAAGTPPKLLYTIPVGQNPTGATVTPGGCHAMRWCSGAGVSLWIGVSICAAGRPCHCYARPGPRSLRPPPTPDGTRACAARRREVYELCREFNLLIIEDDAYFYLQYPRGPGEAQYPPPGAGVLPADHRGQRPPPKNTHAHTTQSNQIRRRPARYVGPGQ